MAPENFFKIYQEGYFIEYLRMRIWSHLLKKPLMKNFIFCEM